MQNNDEIDFANNNIQASNSFKVGLVNPRNLLMNGFKDNTQQISTAPGFGVEQRKTNEFKSKF
jgi:hypothetical protein